MKLTTARLSVLVFALVSACTSIGVRSRPPLVSLPGIKYSEQRLRGTDLTFRSGPYKEPAGTPTTILTIEDGDLRGFIRLRKAKDPNDKDPVPDAVNQSAYFVARKRSKHFRWGEAKSCLAQFTNENHGYAPNNDDLLYQVAGMTSDGKFSVFANFAIAHPSLPTSQKAQDYKGDELDRLESHPDMRLIEHAPDGEFRPGINRIDGILDSLEIHE